MRVQRSNITEDQGGLLTIPGYKSEFQSMSNKLTNELCKREFQEAPEQTNFVSLSYSVTSDRVSLIGSTCGVFREKAMATDSSTLA